jgi:hypothetical protein
MQAAAINFAAKGATLADVDVATTAMGCSGTDYMTDFNNAAGNACFTFEGELLGCKLKLPL